MDINTNTLRALNTTVSTLFHQRMGSREVNYKKVATVVKSTSRSNTYTGMKMLSGMREWIGPRHIDNLQGFRYEIENKPFEKTFGIDRDDIEDDNLGQYDVSARYLGEVAADHPEELVFDALANGFTAECYDGQYFFDTDHPLIGDDGETVGSFANTDGGSDPAWFLISSRSVMLPIIFQERKKATFAAIDNPNDEHVFKNKEFVYGVDSRDAVGYSFPQLAWGSKQPLTKATYKLARESLAQMKGDGGRPLKLKGDLLVFPPSMESEVLELLNAEKDAAGATNIYRNTAKGLEIAWLG